MMKPMRDEPMATTDTEKSPTEDGEILRERWLERLSGLVETLENWAQELDWSTRKIQMKMKDSQIGTYEAPALIFQKEKTRALLEPIARSAPGTEGVVDLYVMPAFDDIATLYFYDGGWQLHYMLPGSPIAAAIEGAGHRPLSKETFQEVLEAMVIHAESPQ
jgi:hypothetical protein